jgi:hypothetical protein
MARLKAGISYLTLDGVDVSAYCQDIDITADNESEDVTAGNVTHEVLQAGINTTKITLNFVYEVGSVGTLLAKIKRGAMPVMDWGPEGNVSGKPRHTQQIIITSLNKKQDKRRTMTVLAVSASGAAAPTNDMDEGAIF